MTVARIFKDFDDESHHYFIAKDIAEHIDIAIDEIKALKGFNQIIGAEVIFKDEKCEIIVSFLNPQEKTYSWTYTNKYRLPFRDSIAKVLYCWINKWKDSIQDEWGDCVGFYFN